MSGERAPDRPQRIAVVLKGYPRLSETFIAQEILALEKRGIPLEIWSLRKPTDPTFHPMHKAISAPLFYLPEYLYQEPWRVLRGMISATRRSGFTRLMRVFWQDLRRDGTANRIRRLGQAFVMARELAEDIRHIHVHFLHTPASVVRYTALLTGRSWSFSAHAKDIWTTPDWEKREKIADAAWGVTCTEQGAAHLAERADAPDKIKLLYHGLDLDRFPEPPQARPPRDGSDLSDPVRIISVGRAVAKKGYDDLILALAALPKGLHWQFVHVGGGEILTTLQQKAARAGLDRHIVFMGPRNQTEIITLLREADLFVLPSKRAKSGDQDGLPNVLMEAASQKLAIVATDFAGIPEFLRDGQDGMLVPPSDWEALSNALNLMCRDPKKRHAFGSSAYTRLRNDFSMTGGIDWLEQRFRPTHAVKSEPEVAPT